ncbi:MAG TPA: NHL repeat-containing protein [Chloroflexota bacterium]|nr:NHL repeat-containing protein [Chloroflexota bacterium]
MMTADRWRRQRFRRWLRAGASALLALGLLVTTVGTAFADREYSWTLDKDNLQLTSPLAYLYDFEIDGMYKPSGTFKNPADIFVDRQFNVWVADTGNNRILKFDEQGNFLAQYGTTEGEGQLNAPEGIFVTDRGEIWVADRGNGRIVQYSPEGQFVRALGKPRSRLLEEDQVYQPNKLVLDKRGYIYVLNGGGDYRGIFLLDSEGEFRGFFGANRLGFDVARLFIRMFATEAQKKQISKVLPTHHANLFIDQRGFVYTTSPLSPRAQIKKLNPIGNNVYSADTKFFGERERKNNQFVNPQFVDVTVDERGVVSALDFNSGRIYQYDQSANLLTIFGGRGAARGRFELPQSLAVGRNGRIFVLDANRNNIQIFRPTEFAELLHTGSQLFYDGKYQEASQVWQEVLRRNSFYELAHTGMGKAAFKQGDYMGAMDEYQIARNKDGYSQAFGEWRHEFLRENFGWVLPLAVFSVWVIATVVGRTVKQVMSMKLESEGGPA